MKDKQRAAEREIARAKREKEKQQQQVSKARTSIVSLERMPVLDNTTTDEDGGVMGVFAVSAEGSLLGCCCFDIYIFVRVSSLLSFVLVQLTRAGH